MNQDVIYNFIVGFQKYTKELANSKEKSQEFLTDSGIYTEEGELTEDYIDTIGQGYEHE